MDTGSLVSYFEQGNQFYRLKLDQRSSLQSLKEVRIRLVSPEYSSRNLILFEKILVKGRS